MPRYEKKSSEEVKKTNQENEKEKKRKVYVVKLTKELQTEKRQEVAKIDRHNKVFLLLLLGYKMLEYRISLRKLRLGQLFM